MCRNECCAPIFKQMTHDRTRKRRAFLRIGPRTKFIEDDKRAIVDVFEDADDVCDVTAERAKRLLDRLLVTDICIDRVETQQLRAAPGGDVQSALCHQCKQTDGFQRNSLSTCVGTGDDDGACI